MDTDTEQRPVEQPEVETESGGETSQPESTMQAEAQQGAEPQDGENVEGAQQPSQGKSPEDRFKAREAEILAAKDREIAQLRQAQEQARIDQMLNQMVAQEREAEGRDRRKVDEGLITEDEARERQQVRIEQARVYFESQKLQRERAELDVERAKDGKRMMAEDLGQEFGIDYKLLLSDPSLTDQVKMLRKAYKLAEVARKAKEAKFEYFDRGPSGGTGKAIPRPETPSEWVAAGLRDLRRKGK